MLLSHVLHGFTFLSVKLLAPMQAQRALNVVAAALPRLTREASGSVLVRLRGGSCLTRSMTVAARLAGASVVIGVPRPGNEFQAHAWVEQDGRPLLASDPRGDEIARFASSAAEE